VRGWTASGGKGVKVALRHPVVQVFAPLMIALVTAWIVMVAGWPYAIRNPFSGPVNSFMAFNHFDVGFRVLFEGQMVPIGSLPWRYIPEYLLVGSPELWLVLAMAGLVLAVVALVRAVGPERRAFAVRAGLLALAGVFPVAYIAITGAPVYTGLRHVIFVLPALSCLGGIVLARLLVTADGWKRAAKWPLYAALGAYAVFHVSQLVVLHPFEYVYFNPVSGGLKAAAGRYELDDCSQTLREAATRLVSAIRAEEPDRFEKTTYKVFICPTPFVAVFEFPPNIRLATESAEVDFVLMTAHSWCAFMNGRGRVVCMVERMGVPLAYGLDFRKGKIRQPAGR